MKKISIEQWGNIILAASNNTDNMRGCRQRKKAYAQEIMRMLDECPGVKLDPQQALTLLTVLYVRTDNLGTKKWPDCYKTVEVSGVIVRETEKMVYSTWGEHIRKDKILAVVV